MLSDKVKKVLEKQHYAIVGNHSAVQICRWTKKSLSNKDFCYKQKFYGIKSHRCCQMSPAVMWCQNMCEHCWRPIEMNLGTEIKDIDEPQEIIKGCINSQRKMLSGFGGNKEVKKKRFEEAQDPEQFAISLSGEPTLYPKLPELIKELRKMRKTSFIVTNGLNPEMLDKLKKEKALPTQIYISMNAPNEKMYNEWHKSSTKDAWKRFNKSLEIMKGLKGKTRTVVRMTLVKDKNMINEKEYSNLIKKAMPDFVEVKGFMSVGYARQRLGYETMPNHQEIKDFAAKLVKKLKGYKVLDEKKESRVVLLGVDKKKMNIRQSEI
jgi:tRNA wybutosine-synthesizing protein 1